MRYVSTVNPKNKTKQNNLSKQKQNPTTKITAA